MALPVVDVFCEEAKSERQAQGYEHALCRLVQEGVNLLRKMPLMPHVKHQLRACQTHDSACSSNIKPFLFACKEMHMHEAINAAITGLYDWLGLSQDSCRLQRALLSPAMR